MSPSKKLYPPTFRKNKNVEKRKKAKLKALLRAKAEDVSQETESVETPVVTQPRLAVFATTTTRRIKCNHWLLEIGEPCSACGLVLNYRGDMVARK